MTDDMYRIEPFGGRADQWIITGPEMPLAPGYLRIGSYYTDADEAEHIAQRMNYARRVALEQLAVALAAAREQERAKIVAWLCAEAQTSLACFGNDSGLMDYAARIERGDHDKPGGGA